MTRKTSVDVYRRIEAEGLLTGLRWKVYSALFISGPMTISEVEQYLGFSIGSRSLSPRFAEMVKMDAIYDAGIRDCRVKGNTVHQWDVTDRMPIKLKKPDRVKCGWCHGRGYLENKMRENSPPEDQL